MNLEWKYVESLDESLLSNIEDYFLPQLAGGLQKITWRMQSGKTYFRKV